MTGLSGSCMQMEQYNFWSRRSKTSLLLLLSPSSLQSGTTSDDSPLNSCCRRLAFSWSEREGSAWMARMAAIKSAEEASAGGGGTREDTGCCCSCWSQSGQSQRAALAMDSGRRSEERHGRCQGVIQVLQVRVSCGGGLVLQTMHRPSPSQGRPLLT